MKKVIARQLSVPAGWITSLEEINRQKMTKQLKDKKNPKTETKAINFPPHLTLNCQHGVSCRVCLVFSNLTPDPLERPCRHQPTERGVGSTKPREHHHRALPICEEPQQQKKEGPIKRLSGKCCFNSLIYLLFPQNVDF